MNKRTKIILRVNEQAELFYSDSQRLGNMAAATFLEDPKNQHLSGEEQKRKLQRHRAQLTGLENIAETTLKFTDVLDYIKKQIARPQSHGWREEYQGKRFGEELKTYIEQNIPEYVGRVSNLAGIGNTDETDARDRQYIYLHLIRQFIRQLVVQYEYRVSQITEEMQHDQPAGTGTHTAHQR